MRHFDSGCGPFGWEPKEKRRFPSLEGEDLVEEGFNDCAKLPGQPVNKSISEQVKIDQQRSLEALPSILNILASKVGVRLQYNDL